MTESDEVACRELVELVTDYLEDAIPERDRARLEAHLAGCEGCTAYLEQMRTTIRLAGRLTEQALPEQTCAALLEVFRDWGREAGASTGP